MQAVTSIQSPAPLLTVRDLHISFPGPRGTDRVLVMYGGQIVEECAAEKLHLASHPYTIGLLASVPQLEKRRSRLPVLERDPAWLNLKKGA